MQIIFCVEEDKKLVKQKSSFESQIKALKMNQKFSPFFFYSSHCNKIEIKSAFWWNDAAKIFMKEKYAFWFQIAASNATQVVIKNVSFGLSGNFTCEVTADSTSFSTATAAAQMMVVGECFWATFNNYYGMGRVVWMNN